MGGNDENFLAVSRAFSEWRDSQDDSTRSALIRDYKEPRMRVRRLEARLASKIKVEALAENEKVNMIDGLSRSGRTRGAFHA